MILQSVFRRVPVDPAEWKTELSGWYWKFGTLLFALLFLLCFTPMMTDSHSTPRLMWLLLFLTVLMIIHCITIDYASQRPGAGCCVVERLLKGILSALLVFLNSLCHRRVQSWVA